MFNLLQARGVISVAGTRQLHRPRPRSREGQLARRGWTRTRTRWARDRIPGWTRMTDFLLELRCEEIPARMQARRARRPRKAVPRANWPPAGCRRDGDVTVWSTPRRLALIARGLPRATAAVSEEIKGPRAGAPAAGARRLPAQDRPDRRTSSSSATACCFAVIEKPGRATADVLAEAIPAIVRAFPWPKSMRWGEASAQHRKPALGPPAVGHRRDLRRGPRAVRDRRRRSRAPRRVGHRFHHPGVITIGGARRLCRKAARLPRHRRPGRAPRDHPRSAPTRPRARPG